MDPNFPARAVSTGEGGGGAFADLPAGYYLLTESQAPEGYNGIPQSVVLFLPYGRRGAGAVRLAARPGDPARRMKRGI